MASLAEAGPPTMAPPPMATGEPAAPASRPPAPWIPAAVLASAQEGKSVVDQLKELQRCDATGREQWGAYCDMHGNGLRDPSKHEASFVQAFITQYKAGTRLEVDSENAQLSELIKYGQRRSGPWKQAWSAYCQMYGGGINDPGKHDYPFLRGFLDFMGQSGNMAMRGGVRGSTSMDNKKMALVSRIKAFQRMGEEQRDQWANHCDQWLGGVRDPMRQDGGALQAFCSKHEVP